MSQTNKKFKGSSSSNAFRYFTECQISAKRGPDSSFVVKPNTKSLWPKSSWSRIVKLMDRGRVTQPRVEYRGEYQGEYRVIRSKILVFDPRLSWIIQGPFLGSYTNYWQSCEFFTNSEASSSYLPNLAECQIKNFNSKMFFTFFSRLHQLTSSTNSFTTLPPNWLQR